MLEVVGQILTVIGSALFMIIFFGLCVFVHELGHFLAARMCGLHVIAFSIGFKKVWSKKINGVEYRIGCIPVGGYVDLPQIDATGEAEDENGNKLPKAAPWKRIVTAFSGPFFNVLFALLLGCVIWIFGLPQSTPKVQEFKVKTVQVDKPEYNAGLRPGDVIYELNGKKINGTWSDFAKDIMLTVGDVVLTVRKPDGSVKKISYQPEVNRQKAPNVNAPYPFFEVVIPVTIVPQEGSAAEKAGLKAGDRILKLNGQEVGLDEFVLQVMAANGRPLLMDYRREDGTTGQVTVHPEKGEGHLCGITFSANGELLVSKLIPGLPAEKVVKPGDRILALNGEELTTTAAFINGVQALGEKPFTVTLQRGGETLTVPLVSVPRNQIGVQFRFLSYPTPFEQLANVLDLTWRSLRSVGAGIGRKLGLDSGYTTLGPQHFSGPVGIGQTLYLSVYKGSLIVGLNLVVLISFSLALFNLLPLPVLDGGHIMLACLEMIFRRPISAKVLQPLTIVFVVILIGFMIFVTIFDIKRLLPVEAEQPGKIIDEQNMEQEEKAKPVEKKEIPQMRAMPDPGKETVK
ncbi:MAG: RIP metalloprotease RseP [Lentisphaerae bacterium]|nr:RIP metalloprotease RseP [Lentisphaerota bacterium]